MGKYFLFMLCLLSATYSWAQKKPVSKQKRKATAVAIMEPPPPDEHFRIVSKQAEYPGGNYAFQKYINEHLRYPDLAREEGIEGTVKARFVVGETGKIARVDILKDIGGGCGKELKRVLSSMTTTWKPYKYNGQSIPSVHMLDIKFSLR